MPGYAARTEPRGSGAAFVAAAFFPACLLAAVFFAACARFIAPRRALRAASSLPPTRCLRGSPVSSAKRASNPPAALAGQVAP